MLKKKVKIGALEYRIEYRDMDDRWGCCDFDNLKIVLDPTQHKDLLQVTFLHECIHAILLNAGVKPEDHDERTIDAIANGVIALLHDNDLYNKELIRCKKK